VDIHGQHEHQSLLSIEKHRDYLDSFGKLHDEIAKVGTLYGKVEALKKDMEALSSEIDAINDFKGARTMDLNILADLTSVLPKNAWLTRMRITDTSVEIEGYANSATELLPKLEASKYMRKVEFASPTFRDVRLNADRFSIKMEIMSTMKKDDKIKGDKGKNAKK